MTPLGFWARVAVWAALTALQTPLRVLRRIAAPRIPDDTYDVFEEDDDRG